MRFAFALLIAAAALWPAAAQAYENFIPLGQSYAIGQNQLPPLNSPKDQFNTQVDIYQSEVYMRQRIAKEFQSRVDQFSYSHDPKGASVFIDY
ncbi:MAG: hypothetical protein HY245_00835 [Rhizobiales bacterium]|nr:hypothetical protein [Hyphomicrobiales bacterium]MBI3671981.1 hypothetical protein [Hyphomicrobiales bacterium]